MSDNKFTMIWLVVVVLIWSTIFITYTKPSVRYNNIEVTYVAKDGGEHKMLIFVDHELDGRYVNSIKYFVMYQGIVYDSCDKFHRIDLPKLLYMKFPSILSIIPYDYYCRR